METGESNVSPTCVHATPSQRPTAPSVDPPLLPGKPIELAKESLYLYVNVASLADPDLELEKRFWGAAPRFLLPPGQYRVRLDEARRQGQRELGRRTMQGPIQVTVRARELVTYEMR